MLVAAFVSLGIVSTYVEKQFAVETKAEREATFIHSGCLDVGELLKHHCKFVCLGQ